MSMVANDMAGGFKFVDDVFEIGLDVVRHVPLWRGVGPVEPERMLCPLAKDGASQQCVVSVVVEGGNGSGVAICDVVCGVIKW